VLSARVLNPGIHIVTRADDSKLHEKLKKAGADQIVNPYSIGGTRMASLLLYPNLIKFFDTSLYADEHNYVIESIIIGEHSNWVGKSLAQLNIRKRSGASIIAIIRGEEVVTNPGGDFLLTENDNLVLFGKNENIQEVENMMEQS
jgi:voltage-gated potassium channel